MEKYVKAMDAVWRLIKYFSDDPELGYNSESARKRWEERFNGIIEVGIYDPSISQKEFAQLQACCKMSREEYQIWRINYGK